MKYIIFQKATPFKGLILIGCTRLPFTVESSKNIGFMFLVTQAVSQVWDPCCVDKYFYRKNSQWTNPYNTL